MALAMSSGLLTAAPVSASSRRPTVSSVNVGNPGLACRNAFLGAPLRSCGMPGSAAKLVQQAVQPRTKPVAAQANLFDRFGRVTKGYAFFYGDQAVKQLEDPRKMLDQAVNDMQADLIKMKEASNQVFASQKAMEDKYRTATTAADIWMRRAELALQKGDEDLAREALKRRKDFQATADAMKGQLDVHNRAANTLLGNIRMLENKVSEAATKKETLKARAITAQSSKMLNEEINNLVSGLRSNNGLAAFKAMEEKVMVLEAEAEASASGTLSGGDVLEGRFALLEGGSTVDDELLKLKSDMMSKGSYTAPALPQKSSAEPRMYDVEPRKYNVDIYWP